jgi:hypothetical protein
VQDLILLDKNIYANDQYDHLFFETLRKDLIVYMAKTINHHLKRNEVYELDLTGSTIGREGSEILALLMKFNPSIGYIDLSGSKFEDGELKVILASVQNNANYFSMNLQGVHLSLPILKVITNITKNDNTKEIQICEVNFQKLNISKVTRPKYNAKQKVKRSEYYPLN